MEMQDINHNVDVLSQILCSDIDDFIEQKGFSSDTTFIVAESIVTTIMAYCDILYAINPELVERLKSMVVNNIDSYVKVLETRK